MYQLTFILLLMTLYACSAEETHVDAVETLTEEVTEAVASLEENSEKELLEEIEEKTSDETEETVENDKEQVSLQQLTVHYIDVGQGDATLLQYSDEDNEYVILYDVGDWRKSDVVQFLQKENIQHIDLIIVTHPHADHIGQLDEVIEQFSVDEVWMSGNTANTNVFENAMEAILQHDIDYDEPRAGDMYDIGPLEAEVLHPQTLTGGLNEDSISIRFTYGTVSFLFTGDSYKEQERQMMQRTNDISADVLHLGHHGSNTSSAQSFIEAVSPTYAIYSASANNSYGHPHAEVIDLMENYEITLFGTDVHGTVTVTTDGNSIDVQTEKDGTVRAGVEEPKETKPKQASTEESRASGDCIDINHASLEELTEIIHIGEIRAQELIDLRPFSSVDELSRINGIGASRLADIKAENKACVGGR